MAKQYLGEALPKRPSQLTNKLKDNGGFVTSLDGVVVDVRSIQSGGSFSMPTLEGVEFDRMRRYGLVLNRWAMSDVARRSKKSGYPLTAYTAASRLVSNHMFRQVFDGEDPGKDTVNITPYVNAIKAGSVTRELLHAIFALHGTGAFTEIVDSIPDTYIGRIVKDHLTRGGEQLSEYYVGEGSYYFSDLNDLHSRERRKVKSANNTYESIVQHLDVFAKTASNKCQEHKLKKGAKDKKQDTKHETTNDERPKSKVVREIKDQDDVWATAFVAKYPLELPHTGKLGRREIATNEGRQPKAFYRLVTDPYRRIFKRKTRSLGGVVVFDCSGSMGLSNEDIHRVLKASAGCSIICYSASGEEERDRVHGNIHVVAKNGRQMRGLPHFFGGNGVDLPALRYGHDHLRQNGKSPVIWVSDGQVTGRAEVCSLELRQQARAYTKRHGIVRVGTVDEAIALLTKLQKGIRS